MRPFSPIIALNLMLLTSLAAVQPLKIERTIQWHCNMGLNMNVYPPPPTIGTFIKKEYQCAAFVFLSNQHYFSGTHVISSDCSGIWVETMLITQKPTDFRNWISELSVSLRSSSSPSLYSSSSFLSLVNKLKQIKWPRERWEGVSSFLLLSVETEHFNILNLVG